MHGVILDCILGFGCCVVDTLESVILLWDERVFCFCFFPPFPFFFLLTRQWTWLGYAANSVFDGSSYLSLVFISLVGVCLAHVWLRDQPAIWADFIPGIPGFLLSKIPTFLAAVVALNPALWFFRPERVWIFLCHFICSVQRQLWLVLRLTVAIPFLPRVCAVLNMPCFCSPSSTFRVFVHFVFGLQPTVVIYRRLGFGRSDWLTFLPSLPPSLSPTSLPSFLLQGKRNPVLGPPPCFACQQCLSKTMFKSSWLRCTLISGLSLSLVLVNRIGIKPHKQFCSLFYSYHTLWTCFHTHCFLMAP